MIRIIIAQGDFMKIQPLALLAAFVLMFLGTGACTSAPIVLQLPPPPAGVSGDIQIGMVVPLSGPIAGLGNAMKNSAEMAQQEINAAQLGSARIQFVIEDSAGTPEVAVAAFEKLIAEGEVVAILGPATSASAAAAFPIAQEAGMVALSPVAGAAGLSEIGDFVFQGNLTVDVVVPGGVALTQAALGYTSAAILVDELDLFSQNALEILEQTFADNGVEVVAVEPFQTGDIDFSAQFERILAAAPDTIFVASLPAEAAAILINAREVGVPAEIPFILPLALSNAEVAQAGEAAEGAIAFSTWDIAANTPGNQAYVQRYRETYGSDPNRFGAQWHASMTMLAAAIRQAGSLEAEAIRDALLNLGSVDTILGTITFDETGSAVYDPIIQIVRDGALVPFE
ncbi:ABC transporter substrate-binding protein [bacterium]|nr:ABC transporter substrate-binding protein [bacterium]